MAYKRKAAVLRVEPDLLYKLKVLAAQERTTIRALTEEALTDLLANRDE